jgi:formylglycine-generating enzyme required for sulfatase activity
MGAPPEKQGIGEELRARWKEYVKEEGDPEERARQHIADWNFAPGKRGEEDRQRELEWWTNVFRDKDLKGIEERLYRHDETPANAEQKVDGFRLNRCPALNAWYRLFAPGHGEVESAYLDKYRAASPNPKAPVIFVSWYDAWAFALWAHWDGRSSRLPREYEWEYAAKAGTDWDQNYWWGDDFDADKCNAESRVGHATPPSTAHANPWGFEDILGNVWEWCEDWYRVVYDREAVDEGSRRVGRGGSWGYDAWDCRSAFRFWSDPAYRFSSLGFRLARSSVSPD